jgi:gliding motility-associated-like protein
MEKNTYFLKITTLLFALFFVSGSLYSQCVWQVNDSDNFEYSTVIPGYINGTTYHPSPAIYAARTGIKGFYMNFQNGLASNTTVLSRSYAVCQTSSYRFKTWVKEINGGSSTITLQVRDNNNAILATLTNTYVASAGWVQWATPTLTPITGTIYFEVIYNGGVGNNDFGMDDLTLEVCAPPVTHNSVDFCASGTSFNLFDSLTTLTGNTGAWSGPSVLTNGSLGTFDPTINTSGTYDYTISDPNPVCPDSIESFNVVVGLGPTIDLGNDTNLCTNEILTLDVTNTNATYLWQDNSTNSVFNITQPGTYWVQVSDSCSVVSDTINIQYHPYPTVSIGNDTNLCMGESLQLNATTSNATYLWSTNNTTTAITVQNQGSYWVAVTVDGCTTHDTLLANFTPSPSVNLGNDTTLCQGQSIILQANNTNATYQWQDGSANPIFFVNASGTYWVEASINNCKDSDTIQVDVTPLPSPNLGNDTSLCTGETFTLNGSSPNCTYSWHDGSTDSTFMVSQQGTYWVAVTNNCGTVAETLLVNYNSIPLVDLGSDFNLCNGLDTTLSAKMNNATYHWSDNSTLPTLNVSQNGLYWVQVTVKGCTGQDSINANVLPTPSVNLGADSMICTNKPVLLNVSTPNANYVWNDGSKNATFNVSGLGQYWVQVSIGPCIAMDSIYFNEIICELILEMPNIFTPNADNMNDAFTPIMVSGVSQMTTTIYSRWGNEVYSETDRSVQWNGSNKKSEESPSGLYFWIINATGEDGSSHQYKGTVTLVR